ncbi:hypothetical protein BH09PAT4_BH09PAT4_07910 [soil metagenome]
MSLLHPTPQTEAFDARPVSLDGIKPDEAIDLLRSVQNYGEIIVEDLGLPADYSHQVEQVAAAAMRQAVEVANPSGAVQVTSAEIAAIRKTAFADTIPPSREEMIIEEYEFTQAMKSTREVGAGELAFMTRCLLRSAVRAEDPFERKQSQHTLNWLETNQVTRSVAEQVTRPMVARAKRALRVGQSALRQLRLPQVESQRRIRTRAA